MNNRLTGKIGEFLAILLLKLKFYKILATNYLSRYGEIDIIACKKDTIIFFEIKVRTNIDEFDQPVHYTQIERIKKTANLYIVKNKQYFHGYNIRFDLIIIRNLLKLEHYKNVW